VPPRKATSPEPSPTPQGEGGSDTREALTRLLNPLDLVLLTRERIQATLDDAVERGRMTRADATELAGALVERGRRQTEDLLADVEQLLGRSRDQLDERSTDVKRRVRSGGFPVPGYDELTAAQVAGRLSELTPAELRKVRDYEKRNANRKSVLAAVEQKLS
jgi:polyhydroxyalkanoate synthesis regulator phasin